MKHKITLSSLLVSALFMALAPTAFAATTWYVNGVNGNDRNNCKSAVTACKTIGHAISLATSGDSIMVAAATYRENLTIRFSLAITGAGASKTIVDGGGVNTVVTISSATQVRLSNLTIRNGVAKSGGGINNSGTLTVNSSVLSGNMASLPNCHTYPCIAEGGGIDNRGALTLNSSILTGNKAIEQGGALGGARGGGIHNFGGNVVINNTTVIGNSASFAGCQSLCRAEGGGIFNDGTLTLNNSTLSGNSTFSDRGIGSGGGGIENLGSTAINNSTLTGNSGQGAGGGIENPEGSTASINNSTLSGNSASDGGAIKTYMSTVTLQNSIVATSPSGGNCSGSMSSLGYNLSSDNTCNFNNTGDLNNTDPLLGPLQNNGGPTQTMALLPGSPAIDAGNPSGCTDGQGHLLTTDQRGMPRHDKEDSGGCDMGAYEKQTD